MSEAYPRDLVGYGRNPPLADWPGETITPQEATKALRRDGFDVPKNYAFNRFAGMVKRGLLVRVPAAAADRPRQPEAGEHVGRQDQDSQQEHDVAHGMFGRRRYHYCATNAIDDAATRRTTPAPPPRALLTAPPRPSTTTLTICLITGHTELNQSIFTNHHASS